MQLEDILSTDELPPSPKRIKTEDTGLSPEERPLLQEEPQQRSPLRLDASPKREPMTSEQPIPPKSPHSPHSPHSSQNNSAAATTTTPTRALPLRKRLLSESGGSSAQADADSTSAVNKSIDDRSEDEAALAMLSMFGNNEKAEPSSSEAPAEASAVAALNFSQQPHTSLGITTPTPVPPIAPSQSPQHGATPTPTKKAHGKAPKPKRPRKKRNREEDEDEKSERSEKSGGADGDEPLYCVCRKPYDPNLFMICCDTCDEWFHGECVNVSTKDAKKIQSYMCPLCVKKKREEEERREQARLAEERRQQLLLLQQQQMQQRGRIPKTDRPCLFGKCGDFAREGSNYCSHECGVRYALINIEVEKHAEAMRRKQMEEELRRTKFAQVEEAISQQRSSGRPIALIEEQDIILLGEIRREIMRIQERRQALVNQQQLLQLAIDRARRLPPVESSNSAATDVRKQTQRAAALEVVDCISCGQPMHHSKLARHMETCYLKVENTHMVVAKEVTKDEDGMSIVCCDFYDPRTKLYCKKLKASCPMHSEHFKTKKAAHNTNATERCGCPSLEYASGVCELSKEECDKHLNWESMRTGELLLEQISLTQAMNAFLYDERVVMDRMIARREMLAVQPFGFSAPVDILAPTAPLGGAFGSLISAGR